MPLPEGVIAVSSPAPEASWRYSSSIPFVYTSAAARPGIAAALHHGCVGRLGNANDVGLEMQRSRGEEGGDARSEGVEREDGDFERCHAAMHACVSSSDSKHWRIQWANRACRIMRNSLKLECAACSKRPRNDEDAGRCKKGGPRRERGKGAAGNSSKLCNQMLVLTFHLGRGVVKAVVKRFEL